MVGKLIDNNREYVSRQSVLKWTEGNENQVRFFLFEINTLKFVEKLVLDALFNFLGLFLIESYQILYLS